MISILVISFVPCRRFASLRGGTTKQSMDYVCCLDCFIPRSDAKRVKSFYTNGVTKSLNIGETLSFSDRIGFSMFQSIFRSGSFQRRLPSEALL